MDLHPTAGRICKKYNFWSLDDDDRHAACLLAAWRAACGWQPGRAAWSSWAWIWLRKELQIILSKTKFEGHSLDSRPWLADDAASAPEIEVVADLLDLTERQAERLNRALLAGLRARIIDHQDEISIRLVHSLPAPCWWPIHREQS